MSVINFETGGCKRFRPHLDAYLSDELPAETRRGVLSHIEVCTDCREALESRRRVNELLRGAVRKDAAPLALRQRIRQDLRKASSPAWHRWMLAAAAMIALVAAGGVAVRLLNRAAPVRPQAVATTDANVRLLEIGLGDHVHCAIDKGFANLALTEEQMAEKLGADFIGLVAAVREQAPESYRVAVGHRCKFNGREFVHLILKNQRATVSLILTRKAGESFTRDDVATVLESVGAPVYGAHRQGFEVAGFEAGDYLAFVVSDLGGDDNLQIASTLAPAVRDFLGRQRA
jgi:anti-sigma factor (TIGR02949 family)